MQASDKVSAGVYNSLSETYYFFFGDTYVAKKRGKPLSSNTKALKDFGANLPSGWRNGIDAAVFNSNTKKNYFFKKIDGQWQFISKPYGSGKAFSAPKSMDAFGANGFPKECRVDAATYDPIGKIYYFFRQNGSWCSKKQGGSQNVDIGKRTFSGNYPDGFKLRAVALRTGSIDNKYYFFSGRNYVAKVRGKDGFSQPTSIPNNWPNWP